MWSSAFCRSGASSSLHAVSRPLLSLPRCQPPPPPSSTTSMVGLFTPLWKPIRFCHCRTSSSSFHGIVRHLLSTPAVMSPFPLIPRWCHVHHPLSATSSQPPSHSPTQSQPPHNTTNKHTTKQPNNQTNKLEEYSAARLDATNNNVADRSSLEGD